MVWIRRTRDKSSHWCPLPTPEPEAVWKCDDCDMIWQSVYGDSGIYDFINDRPYGKIWAWRKL